MRGATREELNPLLSLLERRVGLRLQSNATQVFDAFDALAHELGVGAAELLGRLIVDSALLEELATRLTVAETHFFRIKPQIDALAQTVLPDLERRSAATHALRFWSAGCSTGEEAYTLAILWTQLRSSRDVSILGTDLHPQSLEAARCGRYGEWSFRDTPAEVTDRYFSLVAHESAQPGSPSRAQSLGHRATWQIADSLRQMVRFEVLNLLSADWSHVAQFDLILCRNVMIYFSNPTAQHLVERLAARLRPGGWLMLGPSDPPPLPATLERCRLTVHYEHGAILYRKQPGGPSQPLIVRQSVETLELPPIQALFGLPASLPTSLPTSLPEPPPTKRDPPGTNASFETELQRGMDALEAAQIPLALEALRRAVYLEPRSALAQFLLARVLVDSAQPDRARVALRQAQRLLEGSDPSSDLHRAVTALHLMLEAS